MTDRSDQQRISDLEREVSELRGELQGMQSYFEKQEAWHKEQLAAAHLERNELRDVIREMRSKPPEERVATEDNCGLTESEKDRAKSGRIIEAMKELRARIHVDLKTAKSIIDGFLRGNRG